MWLLRMGIFCGASRMGTGVRRCVLSLASWFANSRLTLDRSQPWANAEVRAYTFASADDDDAKVIPVKEVAKEGGNAPTSSDLQNGRNRTY